VTDAEVIFLAVGTPSRRGDGHADLSYVYAAAADIAKAIKGFAVVVTKSTVPVGTGDEVERIIRQTNPNADVVVVSNPEFLREGAAIEDFKRPDRIVVGLEDERARAVMTEVYRPLYLNQAPLMFTGRRTAELIKYAGNAFLAMKITFINEIADLCEKTGANVQDVARGIGADNRIGPKFLNAGPGYGGSCFPKDTMALAKSGQEHGTPLRLVETTVAVNDQRKRAMGDKVIAAMGGAVRGKTIGILGLTFKPNTDDMREAPSIAIIETLRDAGAIIRAFDPEGMGTARSIIEQIQYCEDAYQVAEGADCLVLVTEWNAFRSLDFARLKALMTTPALVDLRNVYRRKEVEAAGFAYSSIGRPSSVEDDDADRAVAE
jgi:UDPglucose 6-dehydrogenase